SQINYNRKKDLEFIINSWSFFFFGTILFSQPLFLYKNQIKDSELLSPATTQILNEIQNLSNRNVTSTVQNINKK
ncbi:MAG: hypothetical protein KH093_05755, partial [Roseburia sp.]|nr:hypothetical protein [Roseburia sp.]